MGYNDGGKSKLSFDYTNDKLLWGSIDIGNLDTRINSNDTEILYLNGRLNTAEGEIDVLELKTQLQNSTTSETTFGKKIIIDDDNNPEIVFDSDGTNNNPGGRIKFLESNGTYGWSITHDSTNVTDGDNLIFHSIRNNIQHETLKLIKEKVQITGDLFINDLNVEDSISNLQDLTQDLTRQTGYYQLDNNLSVWNSGGGDAYLELKRGV